MFSIRHLSSIFGLLALAGWAGAGELCVQSGPARAHLLELYTSEGCSSCPPAEQWFSTLKQSPRLWKQIVPVAFHVNYWDQLGWKDKLASPANTARQRNSLLHDFAVVAHAAANMAERRLLPVSFRTVPF
jgi:hypothetical protein